MLPITILHLMSEYKELLSRLCNVANKKINLYKRLFIYKISIGQAIFVNIDSIKANCKKLFHLDFGQSFGEDLFSYNLTFFATLSYIFDTGLLGWKYATIFMRLKLVNRVPKLISFYTSALFLKVSNPVL